MSRPTLRNKWIPWFFLLPGLIIFSLFMFIPMLGTLMISFTEYSVFSTPDFIGLSNYEKLLDDHIFHTSLVNTLVLGIVLVLALTILPLPVAFLIERHIHYLGWIRALLYLPVVIPVIVSAVIWKWLLTENGLFNWVLMQMNLIQEPIKWLNDPAYALWAIIIVVFWRAFGFYLLIYISGLVGIPNNLYEAAAIDGANTLQTFFKVTVPLLRNTIALVTIVSYINVMKVFDEIFIMTEGGPVNASKTTAFYIYELAFQDMKFGYSSAIAVILLVITILFTLILLRFFERKEVNY